MPPENEEGTKSYPSLVPLRNGRERLVRTVSGAVRPGVAGKTGRAYPGLPLPDKFAPVLQENRIYPALGFIRGQ